MNISDNLKTLRKHIPENVQLVCVSKFHSSKEITAAYDVGERIFGESRVQELVEKQALLPQDIQWHFIGHLQTNKIKYITPFVTLIHGVDSLKLLNAINNQAAKNNRVISCLLQLHIAQEDTKFGLTKEELTILLNSNEFKQMKHVKIAGLMGMATFTDDEKQVEKEFSYLNETFQQIKIEYFSNEPAFKERSMGMSQDFRLAIKNGSTMVRIGTAIFGNRNY